MWRCGGGKRQRLLRVLASLLVCASLPLLAGEPSGRAPFSRAADASSFAVILAGAGAEPDYRVRFADQALTLRDILIQEYGYRDTHVRTLIGGGDQPPYDACTLENVTRLFEQLRDEVNPGDQVTLVMIGHGTGRAPAKFNLVGPDITGEGMALLLAPFEQQDLAVINTTSASLPFQEALARDGRVLISATRSGVEKYDTTFAHFLNEALAEHKADRDKNGRVSLWEVYLYVQERVSRVYTEAGRLATEHPTLEDNGDGQFSVAPDPAVDDGSVAQVAFLDVERADLASATPAGIALAGRARELERQVIALRTRKAELLEEDYWRELEDLLVDLARTMRELRQADE